MEKPIRLFSGVLLILIGLVLPIYSTSVYVSYGGSSWPGILVLYVSLVLTAIALFFSAVLIGPAFPGIASRINAFGNRISDLTVSLLFSLGFAGKFSRWKIQSETKAGFLDGIWHGLILPLSLIFSLFSSRIRPYESANKGAGYKIGFVIGLLGVSLLFFVPGTLTFRVPVSFIWLLTMLLLSVRFLALIMFGKR